MTQKSPVVENRATPHCRGEAQLILHVADKQQPLFRDTPTVVGNVKTA